MKCWKLIIVVVLLLLILLLLFPRLKSLVFLSPQGTIDPASLTGKFDPDKTIAFYDNKPVRPPLVEDTDKNNYVLGESNAYKRIEVDLTNQRIYAFEGNRKVYDFAISSGKWGATQTGRFRIWTKMRYVLMTGGSQELGTYYYLPNVPYTMFFYNDKIPQWRGFGIHGTYWHDNFGHPMSHGCINMKTEEVELLYYWAKPDLTDKKSILATKDNPGTEIIIYGDPPNE